MYHLRGNAIPAGRVQYRLSDSYEILYRWGIRNNNIRNPSTTVIVLSQI